MSCNGEDASQNNSCISLKYEILTFTGCILEETSDKKGKCRDRGRQMRRDRGSKNAKEGGKYMIIQNYD